MPLRPAIGARFCPGHQPPLAIAIHGQSAFQSPSPPRNAGEALIASRKGPCLSGANPREEPPGDWWAAHRSPTACPAADPPSNGSDSIPCHYCCATRSSWGLRFGREPKALTRSGFTDDESRKRAITAAKAWRIAVAQGTFPSALWDGACLGDGAVRLVLQRRRRQPGPSGIHAAPRPGELRKSDKLPAMPPGHLAILCANRDGPILLSAAAGQRN